MTVVAELISAIAEGDTVASKTIMDSIMSERIKTIIEMRRKEVAKSIGEGELISKALSSKNIHIAQAAALHPNATQDDLKKALNHPHLHVKLAALRNPSLDKPEEDEGDGGIKDQLITHIKNFKEEKKDKKK